MSVSAIQSAVGAERTRISIGLPLLRLRSDEQLVTLVRNGNDDAFRVLHDRYRPRLLAYVRHLLNACPADAEDVVQDVFVRAYRGLLAHDRDLTLLAWLYRIARNASVDELRRQLPVPHVEVAKPEPAFEHDPVMAASAQRETLSRLMLDLARLPEQQRSALLLRELAGMSYKDLAAVLGTSVPAVKSLLTRARLGLVQSFEARDTACSEIRDELAGAHARGARASALARRHLRDCPRCSAYRLEIRRRERALAALAPTAGPLAPLAKLLGLGGGGAAVSGVTSTGGIAASAGAVAASMTHVAAVVVATAIAAAAAIGLGEATVTSRAHTPSHHPATAFAPYAPLVPPVPAVAATSALLSHLQAARAPSHRAAPSRPPSSGGAAAPPTTGSPAGTSPGTQSSQPPAVTPTPKTSTSTAASCPLAEDRSSSATCSAPKRTTVTGGTSTSATGSSTSPPLGGGSSTPPPSGGSGVGTNVSTGTGTGTGTSTGTATGTSTGTATGTSTGTATGTGTS